MSESRICPECGSDVYQASHYEDLLLARDRHHRKNQAQALEILKLQLRVAELEDDRRYRGQKVERQRKVIRRLEKRLKELGVQPHSDKTLGSGEGGATARNPKHEAPPGTPGMGPPDKATQYVNAKGLRKMRKRGGAWIKNWRG